LALAACDLSGMGYFLSPGNPNALDLSLFLAAALSLAIIYSHD
jgi:hypothetical protein